MDALGADLRAAGYTTDGVAALVGADADAAFARGVWWPALRATDRAAPQQRALAVLVRLFLLGVTNPETGPRRRSRRGRRTERRRCPVEHVAGG